MAHEKDPNFIATQMVQTPVTKVQRLDGEVVLSLIALRLPRRLRNGASLKGTRVNACRNCPIFLTRLPLIRSRFVDCNTCWHRSGNWSSAKPCLSSQPTKFLRRLKQRSTSPSWGPLRHKTSRDWWVAGKACYPLSQVCLHELCSAHVFGLCVTIALLQHTPLNLIQLGAIIKCPALW